MPRLRGSLLRAECTFISQCLTSHSTFCSSFLTYYIWFLHSTLVLFFISRFVATPGHGWMYYLSGIRLLSDSSPEQILSVGESWQKECVRILFTSTPTNTHGQTPSYPIYWNDKKTETKTANTSRSQNWVSASGTKLDLSQRITGSHTEFLKLDGGKLIYAPRENVK